MLTLRTFVTRTKPRHVQELRRVLCEERSDPADDVEDKSAGSGHSSDVGGAGQSRTTPRFLTVDEGDTVMSWTVTDRSM